MNLGTAKSLSRHTDRTGDAPAPAPDLTASAEAARSGPSGSPSETAAVAPPPPRRGWRTVWRKVKRVTHGWRVATIEHTPPWARRVFGPVLWYFDMLLIDHGVFRLFYGNQHRLGERAWRSAQPAPHHLRALKRRGLRTVINLRGERLCGSYWLEQAVCQRKGIRLIDFQIRSRSAPSREEIKAARDLFQSVEYPILM